MSVIWFLLTAVSVLLLLLREPDSAMSVLLSGSAQAVELTVKLVATYAFWSGFFAVLQDLGVCEALSKWMDRPVRFLFPSASKQAKQQVCVNLSASFLGLGNAATPAGIQAAEELGEGERGEENVALFFALACSGLQLLPTTLVGLRAAEGSASPSSIALPCFLASLCAALLSVALCKAIAVIKRKRRTRQQEKNATCTSFGRSKKKREDEGLC